MGNFYKKYSNSCLITWIYSNFIWNHLPGNYVYTPPLRIFPIILGVSGTPVGGLIHSHRDLHYIFFVTQIRISAKIFNSFRSTLIFVVYENLPTNEDIIKIPHSGRISSRMPISNFHFAKNYRVGPVKMKQFLLKFPAISLSLHA